MNNRKCDWCGHGYPAEMMEAVEVDGKAMLWCPVCFGTLGMAKEPENDMAYHEYMAMLDEQDMKRRERDEW